MSNFKEKARQIFSTGISAGLVLSTFRIVWLAINHKISIITACITVSVFIGLAIGLYRQKRFALRITAFIVLLLAVTLPLGIFNPFSIGDYLAAGLELPSTEATLLWLVPVEIILLALVYILDPASNKKAVN